MIPFDKRWIHQVEKQYGSKRIWEQPDIYHIATNANMSAARTLANHFVGSLPDKAQVKFVSNLRKDTSFSDAFHEVVVGAMLAQNGPIPDYEPDLGSGKTPDWYLPQQDGQVGCAVEVVSRNVQTSRSLDELNARLQEIPGETVLLVSYASDYTMMSSGTCKEITSAVREWLKSDDTAPKSRLRLSGFCLTIVSMRSGLDHVYTILDPDATWGSPRPLRRSVTDKVRKYESSCQDGDMALVVAVVADPRAGSSTYEAMEMLFGSVTVPVVVNRSTGQSWPKQPYRADDGVFERCPLLSAVAWVTQNEPDTWTSTLHMNPVCSVALPDQVLKGLQSTVTISCTT